MWAAEIAADVDSLAEYVEVLSVKHKREAKASQWTGIGFVAAEPADFGFYAYYAYPWEPDN